MRLFFLSLAAALVFPSIALSIDNKEAHFPFKLAQAPSGQLPSDTGQNKPLPSTRPQDDLARSRAWIGITAIELNPAVARQRGVPGDHQVMITQLVPNGPAANGGIRPNDIILRVNRANTLRLIDVSAALNIVKNGETVEVVVFRDRKEIPLNVTVIRLELAPERK